MTEVALEVRGESKIALTHRLQQEGRWQEATVYKDQVLKELRAEGVFGQEAKDKAWEEMGRRYPALEGWKLEGMVVSDESFGLLPEEWFPLPEGAAWRDDVEWVYQNGFFVIQEKAGGVVSYRWDRASGPPPSKGAPLLMKLLAENRKSFMDLLGKAKGGSGGGEETEEVRRERRRVEEVEAIISKLGEGE